MENRTRTAALGGPDVRELRAAIAGEIVVAGDDTWDEARQAWNLAVDQRPAAVAVPKTVEDVVEIVGYARDCGLQVAPQGTGHSAAPLGSLDGTILLKLHELRGVEIDAEHRTARAAAGTIWIEVVEAAADHGLAALAGSSPDVGVVGYTLGGGLSWLGRKYGIGANAVTALEVVTADGEHRRVDRDHDPDLFWALRGGGGAFAIVTAIEFELFPIEQVYAGVLFFPVERAREVLRAWRAWTDDLPDELTSVGRILQLPPIPDIPEPLRGNSFVVVEAIYCGDDFDEARRLVEPMRALGPAIDTIDAIGMTALSRLHMDPDHPVPGAAEGAMMTDVDDGTIDAVVDAVVGTPILSAEIRHLGGSIARPRPEHGAVAAFAAPFAVFAAGIVPTPEAFPAVHASIERFRAALEPWAAEHTYLNFAESKRSPSSLFTEAAYHRLRRVKAAYDPADLIRSNHPLS